MGGLKATLASGNEHKLSELARALEDCELELLDAADYPPEEGATYYENALAKARYGQSIAGGWVLGEDSGIEVEALDGGPGLHSSAVPKVSASTLSSSRTARSARWPSSETTGRRRTPTGPGPRAL